MNQRVGERIQESEDQLENTRRDLGMRLKSKEREINSLKEERAKIRKEVKEKQKQKWQAKLLEVEQACQQKLAEMEI